MTVCFQVPTSLNLLSRILHKDSCECLLSHQENVSTIIWSVASTNTHVFMSVNYLWKHPSLNMQQRAFVLMYNLQRDYTEVCTNFQSPRKKKKTRAAKRTKSRNCCCQICPRLDSKLSLIFSPLRRKKKRSSYCVSVKNRVTRTVKSSTEKVQTSKG